jgi:amidase
MDFDFDAYVLNQVAKQAAVPAYLGQRVLDFAPFADELAKFPAEKRAVLDHWLPQADLRQIRAAFATGELDAYTLTLFCLYRIQRYAHLNAVIELNPDALKIARSLDLEHLAGSSRGALHGIPVLLKDNVATGDEMHNTAGAKALEAARADRDAFVAARLRAAGAVLIGKANLSEWANFMTDNSNNGFSVLGGQTVNPHGAYDVGGSSSGSAVAVAAGLVPLSIGSETSGSITYPAGQNSIVGIKPSLGVVSRDHVIPITDAMDTLGPMARTVTDAALLLNAIAAYDPNEIFAKDAASLHGFDFTSVLDKGFFNGKRVGVCYPEKHIRADDAQVFARFEEVVRELGAEVVRVPYPEEPVKVIDVLHYGMKIGLNDYLKQTNAPFQTLQDIILFNAVDLPNRAPYGQSLLEKTQEMSIDVPGYLELARANREKTRAVIDGLLAEHNVALLVSISSYLSSIYAAATCPAVSVPGGTRFEKIAGEPVGITFIGGYLSEPTLIAAAYAFEQAAALRVIPNI